MPLLLNNEHRPVLIILYRVVRILVTQRRILFYVF